MKNKARQKSALENYNSHSEVCSADTLSEASSPVVFNNGLLSFHGPASKSPVSFRTSAERATQTTPDNKSSDC